MPLSSLISRTTLTQNVRGYLMDTVTTTQKWSWRWLGWPLPRLGRGRAFSLEGRGQQFLREEGAHAGMWRRHGGEGGCRGYHPPPPQPCCELGTHL